MQLNLLKEPNENLSLVEMILTNRGIPLENVHKFLQTDDSVIHDYKLLDNIEKAGLVLLSHIAKGNKILIQVDCDVDGYTSAAIMYNYLKSNFENINLSYQVHSDKFHGLVITEEILNKEYQLIIVPDAGSNEYETHNQLKDLDIDLIILDHHETEIESKDAIVVNNCLSQRYPNKSISGAGIVWQFCRCLDQLNPLVQFTSADDYLDLVALGLVADMMDLKSLETKRLIEKGISMINEKNEKCNSFLAAFVNKQSYSLKNEVTPIGLAFYIAPYINSVVRVGTTEERELTFEAMIEENAKKIVPSTKRGHKGEDEFLIEQTLRTLTNVKNRQKKQTDEALANFEGMITQEYLDQNSIIIIPTDGSLNSQLNGLIANKITPKYQRPTLVLAKSIQTIVEEIDGEEVTKEIVYFTGSGRGLDTNEMEDFKGFIKNSNLAEYAEGHAQAFGTRFTEENLNKFIQYCNEHLNYKTSYKEYNVDFIFDANELNDTDILEIASLNKFWGKGIEEALIAIKNVRVTSDNKVLMSKDKNPTLKISINGVDCLKFHSSEEEFDALAPNNYTTTLIDIVGKCSKNEWNGNTKGQVFIEEYEFKQNIMNF